MLIISLATVAYARNQNALCIIIDFIHNPIASHAKPIESLMPLELDTSARARCFAQGVYGDRYPTLRLFR